MVSKTKPPACSLAPMPGNTRYVLTLLDAALAFAAAFTGLPASFALLRIMQPETPMSFAGFSHMSMSEWAVLLLVFIGPATLLGTAAGYLVRRRGRGKLATATALAAALTASTLGLSAFYWWLSKVL